MLFCCLCRNVINILVIVTHREHTAVQRLQAISVRRWQGPGVL